MIKSLKIWSSGTLHLNLDECRKSFRGLNVKVELYVHDASYRLKKSKKIFRDKVRFFSIRTFQSEICNTLLYVNRFLKLDAENRFQYYYYI